MVQQVEEEVPSDRVECLFDIKLEEQRRVFSRVEASREIVHIHEIVVDASSFDDTVTFFLRLVVNCLLRRCSNVCLSPRVTCFL